jgi:hypothetical protein
MPEIRFLENRNIREVWKREDSDFTPWLSEIEPLTRLFDACGLTLGENPIVSKEKKIPGVNRSLDLLVELDTGEKVAIENQYAEGDHDHFTRALAYAIGLEVTTVIIVAESHRAEFVAVADYLNAAGLAYQRGIRVYLVSVEVVGVPGEDTVYPIFETAAAPNEWKAAVAQNETSDASTKNAVIYDIHDRVLPILRAETGLFQNVKPSSSFWKSGAPGIWGVSVAYGVLKNSMYSQIWFFRHGYSKTSQAGYQALHAHKDEIENAYPNLEFTWRSDRQYPAVDVGVSGIGYSTQVTDAKLQEVVQLTKVMTDIVNRYRSEISASMNSVKEEKTPK